MIKKRVFIAILLTVCLGISVAAIGCGDGGRDAGPRLASISVTPPEKTLYYVGEPLDLAGLSVTAEYDDGSTKPVSVTADMLTGYDANKTGLQYVLVDHADGGVTVSEYFAVMVKERLSVKSGDMALAEGECVSRRADSLAIVGDGFKEGTILTEIRPVAGGDNGIVFGASAATDKYWEAGASYYFFFISRDGSAFLGKVHNGEWYTLSVKSLGQFNYNAYHELKCERYFTDDECAVIRCYVNGLPYLTVRDYEPLTGTGYGYRAGSVGVKYKNTERSDEFGDKEHELDGANIRSGNFTAENGGYRSAAQNSLLCLRDKKLAYGTFEANITKCGAADDGIIFGLSENGMRSYWEQGVSYYFFFISSRGTAYLGKVHDGTWKWLGESAVAGYTDRGTYALKIERDVTGINCYVNDALCVSYRDAAPLTGTCVGLRAGADGVRYGGISVRETGAFEFVAPEHFGVVSGEFARIDGLITATKNKSLMVYDAPVTEGTVSVKMNPGSDGNNGIVFGIKTEKDEFYDREQGVSYYFFHISSTRTARLLRIENTSAVKCEEVGLTAGYSSSDESELKVIVDGARIMCYVNGAMYVDYTDAHPIGGDRVGIRATSAGAVFRDFETSANKAPLKADLVLFGHSHAELWENAATDLASLGTVANLGVGGTATAQWVNRIKHITSYDPKYVVMWLGSNDIGAGVPVDTFIERVAAILDGVKTALPNAKIVLFTEFYQPGGGRESEAFRAQVRDMNEKYKARFGAEYIVCDIFDVAMNGDTLDTTKFRDIYHLTNEAYAPVKERLLSALA